VRVESILGYPGFHRPWLQLQFFHRDVLIVGGVELADSRIANGLYSQSFRQGFTRLLGPDHWADINGVNGLCAQPVRHGLSLATANGGEAGVRTTGNALDPFWPSVPNNDELHV
jgi:hypothetical protein